MGNPISGAMMDRSVTLSMARYAVLKAPAGRTTLRVDARQTEVGAPKVWAQPLGVSRWMCDWGCVATRTRTSFRYVNGERSTSLQLWTSEYNSAARCAPARLPANSQFFRLCPAEHSRNYVELSIMWSGASLRARRHELVGVLGTTG